MAAFSSSDFHERPVQKRADVIKIDSLTSFGDLEKAPVVFLHEKHTTALANKNMDCTACHLMQNDRMYPKFKRIKDTDRIEVMNIYHQGCISCHGEMKIAKEKTGPVECDDCHWENDHYTSSRQPAGLDKSLHFRHSEASKNECQQCHHEYNETEKKLFYAKGKEGSCRYCHEEETKENRISLRLAAHIACIDCHAKAKPETEKVIKPPLSCSGCHDAAAQAKIRKIPVVPRLQRNQPEMVLINAASKRLKSDQGTNRMDLVPFNHKAHETYNDTCRQCHHASLESCGQCHTVNGSAEGKGVNSEKAAHTLGSARSCLGCHDVKKQNESCAGCHRFMGRVRKMPEDSCLKCHAVPLANIKPPSDTDQDKAYWARKNLSNPPEPGTDDGSEVPERVIIKRLSDKYGPVDFPHGKILNALMDQIKDDKLASYFHSRKETLCQGCHHNSPLSRRPPNCGNCHGQKWDPDNPTKPGIVGAYHQQCLGCHAAMNIEKPAACTDCHKEKDSSN